MCIDMGGGKQEEDMGEARLHGGGIFRHELQATADLEAGLV